MVMAAETGEIRYGLAKISKYGYGEPIPYRFSNDAYVARLLVPLRSVGDHIKNISFYNEPAKKFTGRGHLACVHYSGNKAFSSRRPLYKELSIRDDVNLLSFYAKNRLAAAGLAGDKATGTAVGAERVAPAPLAPLPAPVRRARGAGPARLTPRRPRRARPSRSDLGITRSD
ncbi:hypothetical protein MSG28_007139 [Choristoneura fumiferana]|uniref:Uncharacterized protein n=1 Tax=Choristoneura fumiferana TaxID=7141 RepID=A0ACC0JNC0_CHOFU|nr:hypothetical protein MSG28_007139 [Choristoneura fumiferana]